MELTERMAWREMPHPDELYGYFPKYEFPLSAVVLFSWMSIFYIFRHLQFKAWYFFPMLVALGLETAGYTLRLCSIAFPGDIKFFAIQNFFIAIASVFICAAIFNCLAKLVEHVEALSEAGNPLPSSFYFRPRFIFWIFFVCDLTIAAILLTGATLFAKAESPEQGFTFPTRILIAGLALQDATFLIFLILLGIFVIQVAGFEPVVVRTWKFSLVLFGTSILMFLAINFRLALTASPLKAKINSDEAFFITLEFLPVFTVVTVLVYYYCESYLSSNDSLENESAEVDPDTENRSPPLATEQIEMNESPGAAAHEQTHDGGDAGALLRQATPSQLLESQPTPFDSASTKLEAPLAEQAPELIPNTEQSLDNLDEPSNRYSTHESEIHDGSLWVSGARMSWNTAQTTLVGDASVYDGS